MGKCDSANEKDCSSFGCLSQTVGHCLSDVGALLCRQHWEDEAGCKNAIQSGIPCRWETAWECDRPPIPQNCHDDTPCGDKNSFCTKDEDCCGTLRCRISDSPTVASQCVSNSVQKDALLQI